MSKSKADSKGAAAKGRGRRGPSSARRPLLLALAISALGIALLRLSTGPAPLTTRPVPPPAVPAPPSKVLVLVIDDAGYDLKALEAFLALPFPLTVAVLPGLPHSAETARRVLATGKELILHQPMEALGGQATGPGAIFRTTPVAEALRTVAANLDSLPGARGLNNHMGSAVTTRPDLMEALLRLANDRGIYYLDSLTVPETVAREAALRVNMRYWERSVFLDNSPDRASILRALEEGKKKAEIGAPAVMIGHIWSTELASTLVELYPFLADEGFSLSTISRLMIEEAHARSRR